jgi:hypothetical protein
VEAAVALLGPNPPTVQVDPNAATAMAAKPTTFIKWSTLVTADFLALTQYRFISYNHGALL